MSEVGEEERYRAVLALPAAGQDAVQAFARALYDESWRVRRAAVERIGEVSDRPAALAALLGALADRGQTGARNAAAEALARMGHDAAPSLVSLLGHSDPDQRKFAADILALIRAPSAESALIAALEDPDANVRVSAAEALGRLGGPDAARALEKCLHAADPLLRLAAVDALVALRSPPALPALAALMAEPRLRPSVLQLLGLVPDPGACEIVARELESEARGVREAAFSALSGQRQRAPPSLRPELERILESTLRRMAHALERVSQALSSDELSIRRGALWAARVLGDPALAPAVAEAARDDASFDEVTLTLVRLGSAGARVVLPNMASLSGPARAAAAEAVVRVADPPLVPLLAELAASPEPDVRIAALRALGKAQSLEALEPLVLLLADPEHEGVAARALLQLAASYKDEVRERLEQTVAARASPAALTALARVAGAEAMPLLRKALRHTDPRVRASSVEATGALGASDALELVRVALVDESPAVRATAAAALGALRADGRGKLFRALFTDSDMGVRAAAAEAVGQAGLTELAPDLERALTHADGQWAASAVRALGRLGTFSADALAQAARHPDPEVIKEGLRAGVTLAESVPIAREGLKNRAWDVRVAAARSLASAAGAESLSAVREALRVEVDPLAREALEEAAERLARR